MSKLMQLSTALLAASALLTGCIETSTSPEAAGQENQLRAAASTLNGTWVLLGGAGFKAAFLGTNYATPTGFALHSVPVNGGYEVLRWLSGSFTTVPGGLVDISIKSGVLVGVNNQGKVFVNSNPLVTPMPAWSQTITVPSFAAARRIAAGNAGPLYALSTETTAGGYKVYQYNITNDVWTNIPGGLIEIASDNNGDLYGSNSDGYLYRKLYNQPGFNQVSAPFVATAVAAGGGELYALDQDVSMPGGHKIWKLNRNTGSWDDIPGGLMSIQADASGRLWGTNDQEHVFRWAPN